MIFLIKLLSSPAILQLVIELAKILADRKDNKIDESHVSSVEKTLIKGFVNGKENNDKN